jgi:hypothetical protein
MLKSTKNSSLKYEIKKKNTKYKRLKKKRAKFFFNPDYRLY